MADLCFIVDTKFFSSNQKSLIVTHVATVLIFLQAAGFAYPVFQLFILQARNFFAGQTSVERLGKQKGMKVELETLFSVNEPLLQPAKPLAETRFLYREIV